VLDDIFIVIITHYKQISGSEFIQWQTHHKYFPKNVPGETFWMQPFLCEQEINWRSWCCLWFAKLETLSFPCFMLRVSPLK